MDQIVTMPRPSAAVRDFLDGRLDLLIDGEWREAASGKRFDVFDPATGAVIARVAEADREDVDRAVAAARRAVDTGHWSRAKPAERQALLNRLADLMEARAAEFAEIEALDNGKPVTVAAAADVPGSIAMFRYMAGWATKLTGTTIPLSAAGNYHAYTVREPVGVVGQIIPWNFPLLMAAWKLAPALAAGCTCILKTAEQTPLSAILLGQLVQQAGFPPGVVNILAGFGETAGAALANHPDVDKIAFTGSTEVGKLIVQAASGNLKKVSLELGGKSPAIVFDDADLETTIPGVASGIFFNQGQTCCAGSRLYVHERMFDRVVEGIAAEARKIKIGHGLDPATEMGPLVSQEQFDRVSGYIATGRQEGATVAVGGERRGNEGYFVEPTVLTGLEPGMKVVREEIFGPVLCAERFNDDDLERLANIANDTSYGLAASVWTRNVSLAHKMASRIKAGTVWVNCHNIFDAALPFGGYKQSGWGREMGEFVFNNYLETKAITIAL
jgi:phenylacetaldehyde dehydrogenase